MSAVISASRSAARELGRALCVIPRRPKLTRPFLFIGGAFPFRRRELGPALCVWPATPFLKTSACLGSDAADQDCSGVAWDYS